MDEFLVDELEHGPLHRFADYATLVDVIPGSGAGVYTIWDDEGGLVYVGIAGRNPAGKGIRATPTLAVPRQGDGRLDVGSIRA